MRAHHSPARISLTSSAPFIIMRGMWNGSVGLDIRPFPRPRVRRMVWLPAPRRLCGTACQALPAPVQNGQGKLGQLAVIAAVAGFLQQKPCRLYAVAPQTEAIIATLYAYLASGNERYLKMHRQVSDWISSPSGPTVSSRALYSGCMKYLLRVSMLN